MTTLQAEPRTRSVRFAVTSALVAALLLGLTAAVYAFWVQTPAGQEWDGLSVQIGDRYADSPVGVVAAAWRSLLRVLLVGFGVVLLGLVVAGVQRRRSVAAALLLLGSLGVGEVAKRLLPRPDLDQDYYYPGNSLPSGHTIATMALLLAIVLMAPPRWRNRSGWPIVVVGAPLMYASVIARAHLASDVLAGVLLTGAAAAVAGLIAGEPVVPRSDRRRWLPVAACGLAALAAGWYAAELSVRWTYAGSADPLPAWTMAQLLLVATAVALTVAVLGSVGGRTAGSRTAPRP